MHDRTPVWAILIVIGCGGSLTDLGDASSDDSGSDGTTTDAVDEDATSSPCGKGQTLCGNTCFVNDVDHCGPSCVQCGAPTHGQATCDGKSCGFTCDALQCGQSCVDPTTDAKNCGACGHDCLGTACAAGACVPENLYPVIGFDLKVDQSNIYYVNLPDLYQAPKSGGATPQLLVPNATTSPRLAIDAKNVYYYMNYTGIGVVPIGGGTVTSLPVASTAISPPDIDSQFAFYGTQSSPTRLCMTPLDAGTPTCPITTTQDFTTDVARNGPYLYFGMWTGNLVGSFGRYSVASPDAGIEVLFTADAGQSTIVSIAFDPSGTAYFSGPTGLYSAPLDGGVMEIANGIVGYVVTDKKDLYWTLCPSACSIYRTPIGGGSATPIFAPGAGKVIGLAVDDTFVYWAYEGQNNNNGIYRVAK